MLEAALTHDCDQGPCISVAAVHLMKNSMILLVGVWLYFFFGCVECRLFPYCDLFLMHFFCTSCYVMMLLIAPTWIMTTLFLLPSDHADNYCFFFIWMQRLHGGIFQYIF
ncbi:unnamed protein product [Ixodes pacificus]